MRELTYVELGFVSGGGDEKGSKGEQPKPGTITRPTAGESERGREVNDFFGALAAFGSWVGLSIYDATHAD